MFHAQHAPAHMGYAPNKVGAMVPVRRVYDLVGVDEPNDKSTWTKIKEWGNKEMISGVPNKWLVLAAATVGVVWYGYSARWFK